MQITSRAFPDGRQMPEKYTCDGENINPELQISGIPHNTVSLLLIMEDSDAPGGVFNHWFVWNIDPGIQIIQEKIVPTGGIEGITSFGRKGYGGPCPPPGKPHRYYFKIFALDTMVEFPPTAAREDVWELARMRVMDQAEYMGTYGRSAEA